MLTHLEGKFPLGQTVITNGALAILTQDEILSFLKRHISGDWGDLGDEDKAENESSLKEGNRIMSVYRSLEGEKIYVITEWDRSVTTVLLPDEY